jgi:hypothetical protein
MRRFGRSMLCTLAILLALTAWEGARPAHATPVMYAIIFHPVVGPAPTGFIQLNVTCTSCTILSPSVTFFDVKDPGLLGSPEWTLADTTSVFGPAIVGPSNVTGITYAGLDNISPPAVPTFDGLTLGPILHTYSVSGFHAFGAGTYELLPVPEAPFGAASMALAAVAAAGLASRRRRRAPAR